MLFPYLHLPSVAGKDFTCVESRGGKGRRCFEGTCGSRSGRQSPGTGALWVSSGAVPARDGAPGTPSCRSTLPQQQTHAAVPALLGHRGSRRRSRSLDQGTYARHRRLWKTVQLRYECRPDRPDDGGRSTQEAGTVLLRQPIVRHADRDSAGKLRSPFSLFAGIAFRGTGPARRSVSPE